MATMAVDGCTLHYEVLGQGTPIALTPGGRMSREAMRPLGEQLAREHRVLLWDRRNTGESDVYIGGEAESVVWADDLAVLLTRLNLAPAYLGGASAGCRVSLLTAIRHPEVVKGLVLWSVSGGQWAAQVLGYQYHVPYLLAAERGGMEAVIETGLPSGRLARSARDEERLRALDPREFIRVMKRWQSAFYYRPDMPVLGATDEELRRLRVPTLVFEGNDDYHPREASAALLRLVPGAEAAETPWSEDDFMAITSGRTPGELGTDLYARLGPRILAFLRRVEAAPAKPR